MTQEIIDGLAARAGFDWSRTEDLRKNTQALRLQDDGRSYLRDYTIVPGSFETKTAFAELDGHFSAFGLAHRVTAGVDWTKQDQRYLFLDTDVSGAVVVPIDIYAPMYGATPGVPASDGHSSGGPQDVGAYLNDVITYGPFDLLVGVRQDRYTYSASDLDYPPPLRFAQNATTPRVGLVYKPPQLSRYGTVSLYANYAESFNPQLYVKLAAGTTPAPSQGKQTELGLKFESLDGRYTASFAAFRINKTNVATPDPDDPTGTLSILSGEDRSQGFELDVSARPIEGLKLLLAASNMRADVRSDAVLPVGDRLVNAPETQATITARYDIPRTPFGVGGSVYYVGAREATLPNTFSVPSYTRVDVAAFWKVRPGVELAVNVQNLGDVRYYDSQDNSLFPGAPRSVLGTVRMSF